MPGFIHCSWCSGKGCMCCEREEARWRAEQAARREAEARKTPAEKLKELKKPLLRAVSIATGLATVEQLDRDIADLEAAVNAGKEDTRTAAEVLADAAYARQFPNGPEPMFEARRDNPQDMALLKETFGRAALERAFGPEGGGIDEIEEAAARARSIQDLADADREGR